MFQLFIPGVLSCDPSVLEKIGCGDFAPGVNYTPGDGPDGPGVVLSWPSPSDPRIGYLPAQQEWEKSLCGRFWIGYWKGEELTSERLARPMTQDGPQLEIGGQRWMVPALEDLPRVIVTQANGETVLRLVKQWDAFGRKALDWKRRLILRGAQQADAEERWGGADQIPQSERDAWEPLLFRELKAFALEALRINYRLTTEVADRMELFTTKNVLPIVMAATSCER